MVTTNNRKLPGAATPPVVLGAIAGATALAVCRRPALWLAAAAGAAPAASGFASEAAAGAAPALGALLLWGAFWGATLERRARNWGPGAGHWMRAALFGAVLLSAADLVVVGPLHGKWLTSALAAPVLAADVAANSLWGVFAAMVLKLLRPAP